MDGQQWLTVQQVAERLQVHPETVREWLRDGRLRGGRISRRAGWRIRPGDLSAFVEGQRRGESQIQEASDV